MRQECLDRLLILNQSHSLRLLIDLDKNNHVLINLCLDPKVIRALPNLRLDSSRPRESLPSADSQPE